MKNIRKILIIFLAVIMSVTGTVCWFLDQQKDPVRTLRIDLQNNVTVYNDEGLTISVYKDQNGTFVPVSITNPLSFNGMLPGNSLGFQVRLSNSDLPKSVSLNLSEISCTYNGTKQNVDPYKILDYMYIIVTAGDGFVNSGNTDVITPETRIIKLSDTQLLEGNTGHYSVKVYVKNSATLPSLLIPNTSGDSTVNLNCRIWFDVDAEDCEDINFTVGQIVIGL